MATKNFDKGAVTPDTINKFKAVGSHIKQGNKDFLDAWHCAADDICKDWGGFDGLDNPQDQKKVFKLIREIAEPQVDMPPKTFDRYCKIARYCLIYHVSWEIASEATRPQLRWCKDQIKKFKTGTREEKMARAWEVRIKLDEEEAAAKKKREDELLSQSEPQSQPNGNGLVHIPLPKGEQDEDAYWTEYLTAQVVHIQKHMGILDGGSAVKTVVLNFLGQALPIVKAAKVKPAKVEKAEAA